MSATLRVNDFVKNNRLFPSPPPVVNVPARQFPVTDHFSRATPLTPKDYDDKILEKVCKAHMKLPPGGILVFLTGRNEIELLCKTLRQKFKRKKGKKNITEVQTGDLNSKPSTEVKASNDQVNEEDEHNLDTDSENDDDEDEEDKAKTWESEIDRFVENSETAQNVSILPLYSLLPTKLQMRVFDPVSEDTRLIVVSTNVAETSVTIPGIKYVIDPGREKQKVYDKVTGASKFVVSWISKASARQRSGRAGRTGPGHCYRLYSGACFNDQFPAFSEPEVLRNPIEDTVLQMKAMNIDNISSFPFPTPPDVLGLRAAIKTLTILEAVQPDDQRITRLGKTLALFPVAARFAKMLVLAHQGNCLPYIIIIAASLSVGELRFQAKPESDDEDEDDDEEEERAFSDDDSDDDERRYAKKSRTAESKAAFAKRKREKRKKQSELSLAQNAANKRWLHPESDLLTNLKLFGGFLYATRSKGKAGSKFKKRQRQEAKEVEFCNKNFVRLKAMREMRSLSQQLKKVVIEIIGRKNKTVSKDDEEEEQTNSEEGDTEQISELTRELEGNLVPPTKDQEFMISQIMCAGTLDRVARKMPEGYKQSILEKNPELNEAMMGGAYQCYAMPDQPVFLHPGSVLFAEDAQPEYCCYHELMTTSKTYMKGATAIKPEWLPKLVSKTSSLVLRSNPLDEPLPWFNEADDMVEAAITCHYGPARWKLPLGTVTYPEGKLRVRHFCRLLLEGKVLKRIKKFRAYFIAKPSCLLQPVLPPMAKKILLPMHEHGIDSKKALLTKWQTDPEFLFKELQGWIQYPKHSDFKKAWKRLGKEKQ